MYLLFIKLYVILGALFANYNTLSFYQLLCSSLVDTELPDTKFKLEID